MDQGVTLYDDLVARLERQAGLGCWIRGADLLPLLDVTDAADDLVAALDTAEANVGVLVARLQATLAAVRGEA